MSETQTIRNTHTEEWPTNEYGHYEITIEEFWASHDARTGPENIRRNWRTEGIDNVLDVAWLREHVSRFDDDALISLLVDLTAFSGDADFTEQIDIIMAARPDEWWMR